LDSAKNGPSTVIWVACARIAAIFASTNSSAWMIAET